MASRRAVGAALTLLVRAFAGEVTKERIELYHAALDDLTDDQLARAVTRVLKTRTDDFLPPPAVLLEAAGVNVAPVLDAERILQAIDAAGTYTPSGRINLREHEVRDCFGDVIADAYSEAGGGTRLFSNNETTRDIAFRDFQRGLQDALHVHGPAALPTWAVPRRLGGHGTRGLIGPGRGPSSDGEPPAPGARP